MFYLITLQNHKKFVTVGLDRTLCMRDMEKELEKEDEEVRTVTTTMTTKDEEAAGGGTPQSQSRARVNLKTKRLIKMPTHFEDFKTGLPS